ncbi:MAG: hypothetical protein LBM92_04495 [Opitutaceae bacterium]|nr:hypothetical protein [Opitutaceae bacterium]
MNMLTRIQALFTLSTLFLSIICSAENPEVEFHRMAADGPVDTESGWYYAESTKGSFSVLIPIPFNDATSVVTENGKTTTSYVIGIKSLEGISFNVAELSGDGIKLPDDLKDFPGNMAAPGKKIGSVDYTPLGDCPSVAFFMESSESSAFMRQVRLPDSIIVMTLEYPNLYADAAAPMGARFLSSLRLKSQGRAARQKAVSVTPPAQSPPPVTMPPLNRAWRAVDYEALTRMLLTKRIELPRFNTGPGTASLERITSPDNINLYKEKHISINTRMEDFMNLHQNIGALYTMYATELTGEHHAFDELVGITIFILHLHAAGITLMDEFFESLPPDQKTETRLQGLQQARDGAAVFFIAALMAAQENACPSIKRTEILRVASDHLPVFKKIFSPRHENEVRGLLASLKKICEGPGDRALLTGMAQQLFKPTL